MQILIINLANATARRKFQKSQLKNLGLSYQILNAISTDDISDKIYKYHYFDWQRPLRNVEVACYYSHRSAWQKIINNNKPALIIEDDALLSKHSAEVLESLAGFTDADFVQLEIRNRKKLIAKEGIKITPRHKLHRLYLDRTGAAGYVLWPTGAKKLIEHENKHGIGLADAHITACYNLVGYQVEPAVIIQLDQCQNYQITPPIETDSHILNQPKPIYENKLFFKFKRITSQFGMLFRQISSIFIAKRRYIKLNKTHFKIKTP
jgi:glycosyl transferase family 25